MIRRPIREIVKDPKWQAIRRSLMGQWMKNPVGCCNKLRSYITPIHSATNDQLRIILNYTTGTAFRIGKIKHPCIDQIKKDVSMHIGIRKIKGLWY